MHTALYKMGGLNFKITDFDILYLTETVIRLKVKLTEVYELLTHSSIWHSRMQNVGIVSKLVANSYGLSGPVSRGSGSRNDIRFLLPYEFLQHTPIQTIHGTQGDNLTRFFLRFEETLISLQYIEYLLSLLNTCTSFNSNQNDHNSQSDFKFRVDEVSEVMMENIIYQFKSYSEGFNIKKNKTYTKVESPRGEFGVTLLSWDKILDRPLRIKVRSPGFYNLSSLNIVCSNFILSDLLSYLSTLDLILGEVDK